MYRLSVFKTSYNTVTMDLMIIKQIVHTLVKEVIDSVLDYMVIAKQDRIGSHNISLY